MSNPATTAIRQLLKHGDIEQAAHRFCAEYRHLEAPEVHRLGVRFAKAMREADAVEQRIVLLGDCTTTWVADTLVAAGLRYGLRLDVSESDYDSVLPFVSAHPELIAGADAVVLLPWGRNLPILGDGRATATLDDELGRWETTWAALSGAGVSRVVQVGYDYVLRGPEILGRSGGGVVEVVTEINRRLRARLPEGWAFLDMSALSGHLGRRSFYDMRRYHWTKQPFSENGAVELAMALASTLRAVLFGPKKVLVVDLDNTLWGGVVGEVGPSSVELGETPAGAAYVGFQRYLQGLRRQGVLLAVVSKNNPADARAPFESNDAMVLRLADFAAFESSWGPKSEAVARLAAELGLGLDSFVFFDDSEFERGEVAHAHPEVFVVDVPDDPADFSRTLDELQLFATVAVTDEDRRRTQGYLARRQRDEASRDATSLAAYLASLELRGDVRPIAEPDMERVLQLLAKTNQFNCTTRRHGRAQVEALLSRPGAIGLTLRLQDRFEDYGLVAVLIAVPTAVDPPSLEIDTWLMSCRALARGAEIHLFERLVRRAREAGVERIYGRVIPTAKNAPVRVLFPDLGFAESRDDGEGTRYVMHLAEHRPRAHHVADP